MKNCCSCLEHCTLDVNSNLWIFGYYDGPYSGMLRCPRCGRYYGFNMLDWSQQPFRFRLLMIYEANSSVFHQYRGALEDGPASEEKDQRISALFRSLGRPICLALYDARNNEILQTFTMDRRDLKDEDLLPYAFEGKAPMIDWFTRLGISIPE